MAICSALGRLHWAISTQFGLDPVRFVRSLRGIPRYARDLQQFRKKYCGPLIPRPCLHDWHEESGATKSEYFWQDLLVARWIYQAKPQRHVDIGSRFDGFVAHVASFREIEVFDVRALNNQVPGVVFNQADLMQPIDSSHYEYCDSLSCLHALEHFGLGRYGDLIDPGGHERGIENMARMLKPGGQLYLSTPIGRERVEFNANRVFDPRTIIRCGELNHLSLANLTVVRSGGNLINTQLSDALLEQLAGERYNLGIFAFTRLEWK